MKNFVTGLALAVVICGPAQAFWGKPNQNNSQNNQQVIQTGVASFNNGLANERQTYALDKLINSQAQMDKLVQQKKAINKLIDAKQKELRAAKIRAKAEKIQISAEGEINNAAQQIEQAGVAVDLPDLMQTRNYQQQETANNLDLMFRDKNRTESVFFPSSPRTNNDPQIPSFNK